MVRARWSRESSRSLSGSERSSSRPLSSSSWVGRPRTRSSTSRPTRTRARRWSRRSFSRWGGARRRSSGTSPSRWRSGSRACRASRTLRSQSLFSLSDVKCYFAWGTDYWADRQEVINRMTTWIQLPNGLTAADLAVERHRRGLPLHAPGQGVHAQRPQDGRGLGDGTPVAPGAGRHRRDELRRHDEAVPRRRRPLSAPRSRRDAHADHQRAPERQPERRRAAHDDRRAVVRHPRHRAAWATRARRSPTSTTSSSRRDPPSTASTRARPCASATSPT